MPVETGTVHNMRIYVPSSTRVCVIIYYTYTVIRKHLCVLSYNQNNILQVFLIKYKST